MATIGSLSASASADGKVFARDDAVVRIPDQEALIIWRDGVQTLVVETRFNHRQSDHQAGHDSKPAESGTQDIAPAYAWLIPIPGDGIAQGHAPEVLAATRGVFPTLRSIFSPRLRNTDSGRWGPVMLGGLYILAVGLSRGRLTAGILMILGFTFLVAVGLLPTLGVARGDEPDGQPVQVHRRSHVGAYDVAIIGSWQGRPTGGEDVRAWLNVEGFVVPPGAETVIDAYIREGWVFVAAKLRPPDESPDPGGALTPHPLAVRFRTAAAVYPLRLTATGNEPLRIDLYVFGPAMARVPGLRVERCDEPIIPDDDELVARNYVFRRARGPHALHISHPVLRDLLEVGRDDGRLIGTKLSGTLSPGRMKDDALISWDDFRPVGAFAHSRKSALNLGLLLAGFGLSAGGLVAFVLVSARPDAHRGRIATAVLGSAACVLVVTFLLTPTVNTAPRAATLRTLWRHHEVAQRLHERLEREPRPISLEDIRRIAAACWREYAQSSGVRGIAPTNLDAPGDYILRTRADGSVEYVVHAFDGSAYVVTWLDPANQ